MTTAARACKRCGKRRYPKDFVGQYGQVCFPCRAASKRTCKVCGQAKSEEHFYKRAYYTCKDCSRRNALWNSYGITPEDYNRMLEEQGHKCAICGCAPDSERAGKRAKLFVDHDHKTGKVRGLLCSRCNRALGLFQDKRKWIKAALLYLRKHSASS